jgi:hypothetical protein
MGEISSPENTGMTSLVSDAPRSADRASRGNIGERIAEVLERFTGWLDRFGEISYDHQSYFAGPIGGRANSV